MKTLDGLMRHIAARVPPAQYQAYIRFAAHEGLGLRDYVGRRVLKMVDEKFAARRAAAARVNSITDVIGAVAERVANEESA